MNQPRHPIQAGQVYRTPCLYLCRWVPDPENKGARHGECYFEYVGVSSRRTGIAPVFGFYLTPGNFRILTPA